MNAKNFAKRNNLEVYFEGNGQGLVGAIGAIGYAFHDHTLELLSYRKKPKFGKERKISTKSVKVMQEKTSPSTFNSFDTKKGRILITPHGPDPVFYGVRGENVDSLVYATKILKTTERGVILSTGDIGYFVNLATLPEKEEAEFFTPSCPSVLSLFDFNCDGDD